MNPVVSVVIPSRNEQFLNKTILDLLENSSNNYTEIIAVLDGYWEDALVKDPRVHYLHKGQSEGMRAGINSAVEIAKGDYIMKIDGHCMVDKGFDKKLVADCADNTVVIPRRKRLDAENWCVQDVGKPDVDYSYLSYPDDPADFGGPGLNGRIWTERIVERLDNPEYDVDEELSFQGSCWFMPKAYFKKLGLMDIEQWGPFWSEAQEIGFHAWLSGGKVLRNKKTWYAHLHKGKKYGRGYTLNGNWLKQGRDMNMKFFAGEKVWEDQIYPLSWLIERFMPIPGWTEEGIAKLKEREAAKSPDFKQFHEDNT